MYVCVCVSVSVLCVCIVGRKSAYACYVRLVQMPYWQVYQTVKFSTKKLCLFPYLSMYCGEAIKS